MIRSKASIDECNKTRILVIIIEFLKELNTKLSDLKEKKSKRKTESEQIIRIQNINHKDCGETEKRS